MLGHAWWIACDVPHCPERAEGFRCDSAALDWAAAHGWRITGQPIEHGAPRLILCPTHAID